MREECIPDKGKEAKDRKGKRMRRRGGWKG
jgi:hypothetical protein